nr:hypothetical protein [Tanacetum cinerariifolium]
MALPETDVGGGIEEGQIESNGFLKAAEPSLGVSNSTTSTSPIGNSYEGTDALEAVKLDPQNACALTHCGILYKDEGRLVESAEVWLVSLKCNILRDVTQFH